MSPAVRSEVAHTLEVARSLGDETGVAGALSVAALGEAYERETAAADDFTRRAAALVDSLPDGDLTGLCEPLVRLAWAEAFLERFADAERHADRGLAIARRTGQIYLLPHLLLCKTHVRTSAVASGRGSSIAWCVLGYAALTAGDPARAREAVLRAGGPGLRRMQPSMRPLFVEVLVTAAVTLGDLDAAKDWAERAREEAERLDLPVQRASAMRSAAQIRLGLGDDKAAADLFVAAADESARSGGVFWEAFSLLFGASLSAADPGGSQRGQAAWQRGRRLALAGGCGMLTGLAEAVGPAVAAAADGPERRLAELTAREREIADLVADGLTSPAIAERLCLSRRTVETHISRVYRKTGVSSRAALAGLMAGRTPRPSSRG
jgi:DNA-binding CsgD family transcriptional regulator